MTPEEQKPMFRDHIDDLFARFDALQEKASVNAVFGQPVTVGEKIVIPIASVKYSFGGGFGEGRGKADGGKETPGGSGAGGGAGVRAQPLALAEITPDGLRIEPIVDEQKVVLAGFLFGAWSVFWIARAALKILRR